MSNVKRSYEGVVLGLMVRKQLAQEVIFRVRRGNDNFGAISDHLYQDKYNYVVPSSINNEEGAPARQALSDAVNNWKTVLSAEQKALYNFRASKGLKMSGYNLYVKEYILNNL